MSPSATSSGLSAAHSLHSKGRSLPKLIRFILLASTLSLMAISIARSQGGIVVSTETLINPHFQPGGSQISRNFGASVLFADLDGQAGQEVIVGAPGDWRSLTGNPEGYVFVFFASLVGGPFSHFEIQAPSPYTNESDNLFGFALAAGDVNGDGHKDLIVGAPGIDPAVGDDSGAVFVFLGPWDFQPPIPYASVTTLNYENSPGLTSQALAMFGWAVAAEDLDGTSDAEIVASAPFYLYAGPPASIGFALAIGLHPFAWDSVPSAAQLLSADNDGGSGHEVGRSISLGNADTTSLRDVILGCNSWTDIDGHYETGKTQIYFNNVFLRSMSLHIDQPEVNQDHQKFGKSSAVGNFNADSFHDLAVGGPNFENVGLGVPPPSLVVVYLSPVEPFAFNKFASLTYAGPPSPNAFGFGLAWGDIDGDSLHELAITDFMRSTRQGIVVIYKVTYPGAVTLTYLKTLQDPSPSNFSNFGYSIRAGRRSGYPNRDDFVVGAPTFMINLMEAGKVVIFNE